MGTTHLLFHNQGRGRPIGGGGGVPVLPDIAGLELWLDGSDIATLFQDSAKTTPVTADGDVVGAMADKGDNGNDATQGTTANKPIYKATIQNGLSIVRFAVNDYLEVDALAAIFTGIDKPMTIFAALKQTNNTGTQQVFGVARGASSNPLFVLDIATNVNYRLVRRDDAVTLKLLTAGTPDTLAHLLYAEFSGTVGTLRIDSAVIGTPNTDFDLGTLTLDKATVGARNSLGALSNYLNGDIYELLVYDSVLSATNRQLVEVYLNTKWAVY